jgi:hypothetical protein
MNEDSEINGIEVEDEREAARVVNLLELVLGKPKEVREPGTPTEVEMSWGMRGLQEKVVREHLWDILVRAYWCNPVDTATELYALGMASTVSALQATLPMKEKDKFATTAMCRTALPPV